jgi:hypothetical protein
MLETIIKKYLFEAREFKAVVKKADIRSYNDAKAAGALYAFDVVYTIRMGKDALPTETEIMDSLSNIISANPSVGASSKYAKSAHKYVLSNNLKDSERRMKLNVWIIPANVANNTDPEAVNVSATYPYKIGVSQLISFKNLNTADQTKYKNINKGAPVTAADNIIIDPTPIEKKADLNPPDVVEKGVATRNLFIKADPLPTDEKGAKVKITYPYTTENGNVLYTMADTDDYIYTIMDGAWRTMRKKDFEAGKAGNGILITDRNVNLKLNQKFGKDADIDGVSKIANVNDVVQFDRNIGETVILYWYNSKTGRFVQSTDKNGDGVRYKINDAADLNVIYQGVSLTNPNYTLIKLPTSAGGKSILYFAETKDIKPVK